MIESTARLLARHHSRPWHNPTIPRRLIRSSSTVAAASIDANHFPKDSKTNYATSANPHYPHMFAPLDLGPDIGRLPNRVIMGSMHTGLEGHSIPKLMLKFMNAEDDHTDLTEMACYFGERAKGGVGLMGTFSLFYYLCHLYPLCETGPKYNDYFLNQYNLLQSLGAFHQIDKAGWAHLPENFPQRLNVIVTKSLRIWCIRFAYPPTTPLTTKTIIVALLRLQNQDGFVFKYYTRDDMPTTPLPYRRVPQRVQSLHFPPESYPHRM